MLAIALEPAFEIVLGIVFVWGCAGGVFITMGRTLFLEGAPASHRARVVSVQGLALMGSAPLSHLLTGLVAEAFGVATAFRGAGLAMLGAVALACLRLRRDAKTTAAP
jgi:predicted MFS family arabinose efflux permease